MVGKLSIVEGGGREPKRHSIIRRGQTLVVGRGADAEFVILDREVSRRHFQITYDGERFLLSDLGSLNGTCVNDRRVNEATLREGDLIKVGATILQFSTEESVDEAVATTAGCIKCGRELPAGWDPRTPCAACAVKVEPPKPPRVVGREKIVRLCLSPDPLRPRAHQDATVRAFLDKHPKDSANRVFAPWQKVWYGLVLLAMFLLLSYDWLHFLHVTHFLCTFYIVVIGYKLVTVFLSVLVKNEIEVTSDEIAMLRDEDLPVYTILVPLYKEKEVAEKIVHAATALDYPADKLDIKVLLEPDDAQTIRVIEGMELPANVEALVVPDSLPKTKPKACNHGLEHARGEYLVIYDAEDRPEPDQLKKAVIAFRKANAARRTLFGVRQPRRETVCLQAKLNYFNQRQNVLTKWFTVEYSTWFDLFLPGLHGLGAPIPLGGTSNHFKTSVLRKIGGWDAFNVTEDCDLGIRLDKMGYETQVLDSTTWEEANSRLFNWIRQRSRWVKGYIQTHLVHMRHPFRTLWQLGPWGTLSFLISVGGLSLMLILNPVFWLAGAIYLALLGMDLHGVGWSVGKFLQLPPEQRWSWQMLFTDPRGDPFWNTVSQVFYVVTLVLVLGNVFFILMHVVACIKRRLYDLIPYAVTMPLYWILISIGAWKGFLQLFFKPFYWEKTIHGLDQPPA